MHVIILLALSLSASPGIARTLWSGSFVDLVKPAATVEVSVNYPRLGKGKICGIEFKSGAMILHRRVWEKVAVGLKVESVSEHKIGEVQAVIENGDGPRLYYFYDDFAADYATLRITTRDGSPLNAYFTAVLGNQAPHEAMIAVARECVDYSAPKSF